MNNLSRPLVIAMLAALCILADRYIAIADTSEKVDICHLEEETGLFERLNISANGVPGHLDHGDCLIDDGVSCTIDRCDPVLGCVHEADAGLCDNGNVCDGNETCDPANDCQPGTPLDCDDSNVCTEDSCDPSSGCANTPNNDPCDDGDACTENDTCAAGVCAGGPVVCPDDGDLCTDTVCDPETGCGHVNNEDPCNDGDPCTGGDVCSGGACSGEPFCAPGEVCVDGVCVTEGCPFPCCGNGVVEVCEQCDPPDGVSCDSTCQIIPACSSDSPNSCCEDSNCDTPGCSNVACCECICGCDPFCCDGVGAWDDSCAGSGFDGSCGASNPDGPCAAECMECLGP